MEIDLTLAEQFLCCGVSDDRVWHQDALLKLWHAIGDDKAFSIAKKNQSASIVACALSKCLDKNALPQHWQLEKENVAQKINLFMQALDRVASAFAEQNIPILALKNSGIARGIFPELAGSPKGHSVPSKTYYALAAGAALLVISQGPNERLQI